MNQEGQEYIQELIRRHRAHLLNQAYDQEAGLEVIDEEPREIIRKLRAELRAELEAV